MSKRQPSIHMMMSGHVDKDEETMGKLRALSVETNFSMTALIREALENYLASAEKMLGHELKPLEPGKIPQRNIKASLLKEGKRS